jgi:predicted nucleic acid-binding protein
MSELLNNSVINEIVISDTTCLIALTNINQLEILHKICPNVVIALEVAEEYGEKLPDWILIKEVNDKEKIKIVSEKLDKGESASIVLAMETKNSLLILDDLQARKYAENIGLPKIGTIGLLQIANNLGLIKNFSEVIEKLKELKFRMPKDFQKKINL